MKKTKKSNQNLLDTINKLKMEKKPFWKNIAKMLERPNKRWAIVNLDKIERYAKDGSTIVVPGKVLGEGQMKKKLTVAAYKFSDSAKKTISGCGGKTLTLNELIESKTDPKNILLIC
ncbi:MAG: 50S ribosomal protein L18e [Candidatus Micrarchaeia archaeon]